MSKTNILLFFQLFYYLPFTYGQLDSTIYKKAFSQLEKGKSCYAAGASPLCAAILQEAYALSDRHAFFLEEILAILIEKEDYHEARRYIDVQRIDTLSNSQKARHYHFKGLLELRSGFYNFTSAFQSFRKAYYCELRSSVPSFKFLSQIQNAMGYSRLLYGGPNKNGNEDYPHTNWMTSDMINALRNFEQALYFDETNENALANKDTIVAKIKQSGLWIEEFEQRVKPKPIEFLRSALMIDEKSKNDTLDLLDYNLLPHNKEVLLRIFEQYDELLLAVDISGSMEDIHEAKGVSRFRLMRELVLFLFHELPARTHTGIVSVGGDCYTHPRLYFPVEMDARKDIMDNFKTIGPGGNTPLIYSLTRGKELYTTKENKKALFLISDGMERCGPPLDLCILASDLYAMGIDLHIISFIMAGMEDHEFAYEIYKCMTRYSNGQIFKYDEVNEVAIKEEPIPVHDEKLLLPPISFGDNFRGVIHFEVDLSQYFDGGNEVYLVDDKSN